MKKVLFISYIFPPMAGGGVYRVLKTLKYLPDSGWNPIVLTVKNYHHWALDDTLLEGLHRDLDVHKTFSLDPFYFYAFLDKIGLQTLHSFIDKHLMIPDNRIGWLPLALIKGLKLIKQNKIDLIFSTSPPHSIHLIAYFLKRLTGKPWVAEFRDHMSLNPLREGISEQRIKREKSLESRFFKETSRLITVTKGNRKDIIETFAIEKDKIALIPNGFDSSDFKGLDRCLQQNNIFTISYTGSFYGSHSPENFFKAVERLVTTHPEVKISINISGVMDERFAVLTQMGVLSDIVKTKGFLSHSKTLSLMVNSHLLLLVIPATGTAKNILTGKIFEYMASCTPILGLVPDGLAKKLIEESGTGFTVASDDIEAISKKIYELYKRWEEGELTTNPDWQVIKRYDRKVLTRTLAAELDKAME